MGLLCTALSAALYASTIKLTQVVTDKVSEAYKYSHPRSFHEAVLRDQALLSLETICVVFVVLFAIRYWFSRGQVYFLSLAANRLASDLRVRMLKKLLRLPVSYLGDRRAGAIQSVLTNDVNVYQNAVNIIRDSIDGPIKAVAAFVTLFVIQWQLALLATLMVPLMGVIIQRNASRMRIAQNTVQSDLAEVGATTQEVLQGARVVKAFGAEVRMGNIYSNLVQQSFGSQMGAVSIVASLRPMVELIGAVALAIFLVISGQLAARGLLQAGDIVAMAFALDTINQGFRSLGGVSNTYAGVQAASDRIHREVLDVPDAHEAIGTRTIEDPVGLIEFENVSFAYPDGTTALKNVSFKIEPNRSLALVGPSGAGKSTIADLVLRFYEPTEGRILFDGVDLRDISISWLRSQIGVVPQQTFLFAGSIEDNLRLGNEDATDDEVKVALRAAHAEEFSNEMALRETSTLGERGIRLSGGQMQRIAIARALIRRPKVLLLDEATSALDATSERAVTEALDEIMKQRTTLFIAHRLTTAARADKVLVLARGEVVEQGSHTELMALNGQYAALFRVFSGGILEASNEELAGL